MTIPFAEVVRASTIPAGWHGVVGATGGGTAGLAFASLNAPAAKGLAPAPLLPASSDPALHSCDMQLADSSGAAGILARAKPYVVSSGLASEAWLQLPTTWYMLTDDPTQAGTLLLFIVHENGGMSEAQINALGGGTPPPPDRTTLVVSVSRASGQPTGVGKVAFPWG